MDSPSIELLHKKVNDAIFQRKPFQEDFLELYRLSLKENYYWQYCPFDVWKSVIERVKEEDYPKYYPDAPFEDFYANELSRLRRYLGNINYYGSMEVFPPNIFHENQVFVYFDMEDYKLIGGMGLNLDNRSIKTLHNSYNKKIAYILSKINPLSEEIFKNNDSIPTSNYLDIPLKDFLDTITEKRNQFSIKVGEAEIVGTKPEFEDLLSELDEEWQSKLSKLLSDKEEYTTPFELTHLDIYNYLEKTTSNFDPIKVKMILTEIDIYYTMDLNERIYAESLNIYIKKGWEIPQLEFKSIMPELQKYGNFNDYKTMINKTHFLSYMNIDFAISVLKDKLKEDSGTTAESPKPIPAQISNRHHQIFNDGGYNLFLYLVQNYTREDKTPKAKFSNLFHYLKHEQLIICSQLQYISFIEEECKIKLSKIQPSNYKYSDQIQPILGRLRSNFQQSLKA